MTNYDEFKAIADDIAEMYANGYAEYAEYFSETFSSIGELSAVTRISDKVYTLRRIDVKDPCYVTALKEIAIDAILAIGEIDVMPIPQSRVTRYYCCKDFFVNGETMFDKGAVYESVESLTIRDNTGRTQSFTEDCFNDHFQKIYEKK